MAALTLADWALGSRNPSPTYSSGSTTRRAARIIVHVAVSTSAITPFYQAVPLKAFAIVVAVATIAPDCPTQICTSALTHTAPILGMSGGPKRSVTFPDRLAFGAYSWRFDAAGVIELEDFSREEINSINRLRVADVKTLIRLRKRVALHLKGGKI